MERNKKTLILLDDKQLTDLFLSLISFLSKIA